MLFADVSLDMNPGEALHLVGPNGVGKSSLLRAMAGLLRPYAGSLAVEGRIALCDERLALDREISLERALTFWAALDGGNRETARAALDRLDIFHLAQVPAAMLSTGQKKRAMLARVVAAGAPVWLLDEPYNGLDSAGIELLNELIVEHLGTGGIVMLAAHGGAPSAFGVRTLALADHVPAGEAVRA